MLWRGLESREPNIYGISPSMALWMNPWDIPYVYIEVRPCILGGIGGPEGVQNQWFGVLRIWPLLDIWIPECSNPGTPRNTLNERRGKYTGIFRFRGYRGIWGPWVPTHRGSKIHEFEVYLTPWDGIYQKWSGLFRIVYFWYLAPDPSNGFRGAPEMLRGSKYRVRKGSKIGYLRRVPNTTK